MSEKTSLESAIAQLGGVSSACRMLGLRNYQTLQQWRIGRVPAEWCPAIESATVGAVRCEDLRPDIDWSYLRRETAVVVWLRQRHPQVLAEFEQCRDGMRKAA